MAWVAENSCREFLCLGDGVVEPSWKRKRALQFATKRDCAAFIEFARQNWSCCHDDFTPENRSRDYPEWRK